MPSSLMRCCSSSADNSNALIVLWVGVNMDYHNERRGPNDAYRDPSFLTLDDPIEREFVERILPDTRRKLERDAMLR